MAFEAIPVLLGNTIINRIDVNYLTVERYKGEKASIMCSCEEKGRYYKARAIDYSLLPKLLGEDICFCDKSKSLYPAVTNIICMEINKYYNTLKRKDKSLPEYILSTEYNSFRLETVLQDYILLTDDYSKNTSINMPRWLCFNPVKDKTCKCNLYTPDDGENNLYIRNCKKLAQIGWKIGENCIIHIDPLITSNTNDVVNHFKGNIIIESNSKLIINGNVYINNLYLKGCLTIKAKLGGLVRIDNLNVKNNGFKKKNENNGIFNTRIMNNSEYILEYGKGKYF